MKTKKISIIGAGNIGGTIAHLLATKQVGNIVLFDRKKKIAKGKSLDILHSCSDYGIDANIIGSDNYRDIEDSDVIIVTAGISRKPGMSRDDLLENNSTVMKKVGEGIKQFSKNAFVICITNPLDVMVYLLQKYSEIKDHKIVGMAGVLDSARFSTLIAKEFNVPIKNVEAYVMGGHGDTMVPITSISKVCGTTIDKLLFRKEISLERLNTLIELTRNGGVEIVNLLQYSAYYAPSSSALLMAESYLYDKSMTLTCAVKVKKGTYNLEEDLFVGVPTKIDSKGAFPLEMELNEEERILFKKSSETVKNLKNHVDSLTVQFHSE